METKPWYQSKTVIAGIGTLLAALAMTLKFFFKVDIADQIPVLNEGALGLLSAVGAVVVIYGRCTATKQIAPNDNGGVTNSTLRLLLVVALLPALFFAGCTKPVTYSQNSPAAKVGQDFQSLVTTAIDDYGSIKSGNVDMTWALGRLAWAYSVYPDISADFRSLVAAWTGNTGDSKKLADRLARIFHESAAPPEAKMEAIAIAAQSVAAAKSKS